MDFKGKEKRKRMIEEGNNSNIKNKKSVKQNDASEEEVEEFFAILRRMQAAVKYFEKGNGEGWRSALEAEVVAVVGDGDDNGGEDAEKNKEESKNSPIIEQEQQLEVHAVLDLNALPEMEEN